MAEAKTLKQLKTVVVLNWIAAFAFVLAAALRVWNHFHNNGKSDSFLWFGVILALLWVSIAINKQREWNKAKLLG